MIDFLITSFVVFFAYYLVSIRKYDENGFLKKSKYKKKDKSMVNDLRIEAYKSLPSEVKYFISKYNVNLEKINLKALLKLIGLVLGIDIAIVGIIVLFISKDIVIELIIAAIFIIQVYLISLKFVGSYFKKKGLIKDV